MDVVNLRRQRRFLRERPLRLNLFDRARLVGELVCLEPLQQEARRTHEASDVLYLVIEGKARLRAGPRIEDLEELDAVLVPPGVEHFLHNPGPGQLTALAMVAPKPARATEVRLPRDRAPFRRPAGASRRDEGPIEGGEREARPFSRPRPPYQRPSTPAFRDDRPQGERPRSRGPAREEEARPEDGSRPPRPFARPRPAADRRGSGPSGPRGPRFAPDERPLRDRAGRRAAEDERPRDDRRESQGPRRTRSRGESQTNDPARVSRWPDRRPRPAGGGADRGRGENEHSGRRGLPRGRSNDSAGRGRPPGGPPNRRPAGPRGRPGSDRNGPRTSGRR